MSIRGSLTTLKDSRIYRQFNTYAQLFVNGVIPIGAKSFTGKGQSGSIISQSYTGKGAIGGAIVSQSYTGIGKTVGNITVYYTSSQSANISTQFGFWCNFALNPTSDSTIFDCYGSGVGYYRMKITSTGHIFVECDLPEVGPQSSDIGILPLNGWRYITGGFGVASSTSWFMGATIWLNGSTIYSQNRAALSLLSGNQRSISAVFADGHSLSSTYADLPVNYNYRRSKFFLSHIFDGGATGYGIALPPTADYSSTPDGVSDIVINNRESLGAQVQLADISGNNNNLVAISPYTYTIYIDGPYAT